MESAFPGRLTIESWDRAREKFYRIDPETGIVEQIGATEYMLAKMDEQLWQLGGRAGSLTTADGCH